uniref:Uncharacterized protein n=1 Tax=viral metagenome TaxID=1070528 RepID=A0A6C0JZI2_9ZZZZ
MAAPIQLFINSVQIGEIEKNAHSIVDHFTRHKILGEDYTLGVEVLPKYLNKVEMRRQITSVSVTFYIDLTKDISEDKPPSEYNNFCSGLYFNTKERGDPMFVSHISYIKSFGNRVGMLLSHLQILLAIKVKCPYIELENMTDVPERAAHNLYRMFTPYASTYEERRSIQAQDLSSQLLSTEGNMRLIIDKGTMNNWIKQIRTISQTIRVDNPPWHSNAKIELLTYLRQETQYGGKRKTKRRKTKRRKTKKRFTRKR